MKPIPKICAMRFRKDFGRHQIDVRTGSFCLFDWSNPTNHPHFHHSHEFCLVLSGTGKHVLKGEERELKSGDLFLSDPEILHEINSFKSMDLLLFFFMMKIDKKMISTSEGFEDCLLEDFSKNHLSLVHSQTHLLAYIDFLRSYCANTRGESGFQIENFLRCFVFDCVQALSKAPGRKAARSEDENSIIEKAVNYISRNLREKLSPSKLAKHCGMSLRNLEMIFKNCLKTSPRRFIGEKRAALAASRLLMGYRVCEVSQFLNIDDPAQFSRFFKKYHKVSPKEYQNRHAPKGMLFASRHLMGNFIDS